jgi:hypothetical protein
VLCKLGEIVESGVQQLMNMCGVDAEIAMDKDVAEPSRAVSRTLAVAGRRATQLQEPRFRRGLTGIRAVQA